MKKEEEISKILHVSLKIFNLRISNLRTWVLANVYVRLYGYIGKTFFISLTIASTFFDLEVYLQNKIC